MRILSYINQFFGQIGGEDMAGHVLEVREGLVGPAMGLNAQLKDGNEIVATVICGDNYAVENEEEFRTKLEKTITPNPQLSINEVSIIGSPLILIALMAASPMFIS